MKIFVTVKTRRFETAVEKIDATHFNVSVTEPPLDGRANEAVIRALAAFFNVAPSRLTLLKGQSSPKKVLEFQE